MQRLNKSEVSSISEGFFFIQQITGTSSSVQPLKFGVVGYLGDRDPGGDPGEGSEGSDHQISSFRLSDAAFSR